LWSARTLARTLAGMVAAATVLSGATVARAEPASSAFRYTCTFPVIGGQPIDASLSTDIPTSLPAGANSPAFSIDADASVNSTFTFGLHVLLGISQLEGSIDTEAGISTPQGRTNVPVHLTIPRTVIPSSGAFTIPATGTAPSLSFRTPGSGTVTVGEFTLHLVPEDANGNVTSPGKVDVPCTLDSGQSDVVDRFKITSAPLGGPSSSARPSGRPTAAGGSTGGGGAASPGASTSASARPVATASRTGATSASAVAVAATGASPSAADPAQPRPSLTQTTAAAAARTGADGTTSLLVLGAGFLAVAAAVAGLCYGPRLRGRFIRRA
jgi:hypothetical protein